MPKGAKMVDYQLTGVLEVGTTPKKIKENKRL